VGLDRLLGQAMDALTGASQEVTVAA